MSVTPVKPAVCRPEWKNPDDESLPLTRCVCGERYQAWALQLSIYADDPTEMPCCGRRLYWSQQITVHEVLT